MTREATDRPGRSRADVDRNAWNVLKGDTAPMALAVAALILLTHGYGGIRHDAELYTLQALAILRPGDFAHEIFLTHAGVSKLSIFSWLYARLIELIGLQPAAAALTFAGMLAYVTAAFWLVRCQLQGPLPWLCVATLTLLPDQYGSQKVFFALETFASPRLLAEAATLFAVGCALRARWRVSAAATLCAICIHPLMGAAGALFLVCLRLRPASLVSFAVSIAVVGLAVALAVMIAPRFAETATMDVEWLTIVRDRSPYLFLNTWDSVDWASIASTFVTLGVQSAYGENRSFRRIAVCGSWTCLFGIAISAALGDGLHLIRIVQAQPWRWIWLGNTLAALLLWPTLRTLWSSGAPQRCLALLLLGSWLLRGWNQEWYILVAIVLIFASSALSWPETLRRWLPVIAFAVLLLVIAGLLLHEGKALVRQSTGSTVANWVIRLRGMQSVAAVALILVFALWRMSGDVHPGVRTARWVIVTVVATPACIIGISDWIRLPVHRELDQQAVAWTESIPPNAEVLWIGAPGRVWQQLHRPSYLSFTQGTAALFSRATALELRRRASELAPWLTEGDPMRWTLQPAPVVPDSSDDADSLCTHSTAQFVVALSGSAARVVSTVETTIPGSPLYLFRCNP